MEFLAIAAIVLGSVFALVILAAVIFTFTTVFTGIRRTNKAFKNFDKMNGRF